MELQGAAAANRLLWEGPAERGRTFLLTLLAFAGGAARARTAGGTDVQSGLVGFGQAAELLSRERVASKQTVAAVREPLARAATAAAPLMRYSDPAVAAATEQLLNALADVESPCPPVSGSGWSVVSSGGGGWARKWSRRSSVTMPLPVICSIA
ncbi:hypothetical protein [Streptomyces sp. NPDC093594]|uniref:hypothetical protein n=1 Tax=Streptomyces sp. NPDC093594 TaxID=3155305 RepID=UPI00344DD323